MASQFWTAKKWITKRVSPDYSDQLDLFSEAVPETPAQAATAPVRSSRGSNARSRPQQLGFEVWEPLPAFEAGAHATTKTAPAATHGADGTVLPPSERPDTDAPAGVAPGTAAADKGKPSAERVLDIQPEGRPSRDFRITSALRIGQGTLHEKARDNIAAIRLLKILEAENREASDDEKAILSLYGGWGAMPNVFGYDQPREWRSTAATVKELLTGPEFESARASTPNAHYTSPLVIEAVWNALHRLGLGSGAQILEPAMGVGHFFGLMPESVQGAHRTGVELDSITARIARKLYPDSTIFAQGFEETPLPDNYFDAVVGNVPFG
jgi:hypothetical protein